MSCTYNEMKSAGTGLQLQLHLDKEQRGMEQKLLEPVRLQLCLDKDLREIRRQGRWMWEGSTHANGLSRSTAFNGSSAQLQGFV